MGQIRFKTFDLGGHEGARKLWQDYYSNIDGVVFLVDALDQKRFQEAKAELDVSVNLWHTTAAIATTPHPTPRASSLLCFSESTKLTYLFRVAII